MFRHTPSGEGDDGLVNGVNGINGINGDAEMDGGELEKQVQPLSPKKPASTRKIRVTYEEYRSISNLLILHLRQMEETSAGEGEGRMEGRRGGGRQLIVFFEGESSVGGRG